MKKLNIKNYKGFTLIEMLVVVLIIGILAGIALPQYQSAVRKARVAEAKISLRALIDAEDRYILEHNDYFSSWDDLDIEIQDETNNWTFVQDECLGESKLGCGVDAIPKWEGGIIYHTGVIIMTMENLRHQENMSVLGWMITVKKYVSH